MSKMSELQSTLEDFVELNKGKEYSKEHLTKRFGQIGFDYLYNTNHLLIMNLKADLFRVKK